MSRPRTADAPNPDLKVAFLRHLNGFTRPSPPSDYDVPLHPALVQWCEARLAQHAARNGKPVPEDRRIAGFAALRRRLHHLTGSQE